MRRLAGWFGFDPALGDRYLLRWWIVLPLALIVSRVGCGMLALIAGRFAMLLIPAGWDSRQQALLRLVRDSRIPPGSICNFPMRWQ